MSAASRWRDRLTAPLRRLRWAASGWSTGADQRFHDAQFTAVDRDPFSPSYPGYLTIRRFADHAERGLDGVQSVVDLGCGPGEITCELARRRPDTTFLGLDHSDVGIATARAHAARLGISNATFEVRDLEQFQPDAPIDLVVMFDAFHHVLNPAALLERLRPWCSRFFLIEPAGTWTGGWNRSGDLDWLPETLGQIRQRLEYQFSLEADPSVEPSPATAAAHAQPTEYRYTLSDFERLFDGFSLDVRGTIAGLERYGPRPGDRSALRDRVGILTYELVVSLEQLLLEEGLDLSAKHWAIHAQRDELSPGLTNRVTRRLRPRTPLDSAQGTPLDPARGGPAAGLLSPYGAEFGSHSGPTEVTRGETFQIRVRFTNTGWLTWESASASPVFASYHWLDTHGGTLIHDGLRTPLPAALPQGGSADIDLRIAAPETAGRVKLAIDLVHEGRTWFSQQGVAPLTIDMVVR